MELNVRDAAAVLGVSTKTIYRWLADGKIPAYRFNNTFRFDRTELLEWAAANRIAVAPDLLQEPVDAVPLPPFDDALSYGGIHYRIGGATRDEVLSNAVAVMRNVQEPERGAVFEALRNRENLASTAIGDGIALPHLRNPLRFHFDQPSVTLCFLENAVDWHALDGRPVTALLVAVGSTVRAVLRLHSEARFALRDPGFLAAVTGQETREAILAAARGASAGFVRPGAGVTP